MLTGSAASRPQGPPSSEPASALARGSGTLPVSISLLRLDHILLASLKARKYLLPAGRLTGIDLPHPVGMARPFFPGRFLGVSQQAGPQAQAPQPLTWLAPMPSLGTPASLRSVRRPERGHLTSSFPCTPAASSGSQGPVPFREQTRGITSLMWLEGWAGQNHCLAVVFLTL